MIDPSHSHNDAKIEHYYQFHSYVYDLTRWSFLFGRSSILTMIPNLSSQPRILEIGCGTGKNIEQLEDHFPGAYIVGLDLSAAMLDKAKQRLQPSNRTRLLKKQYGISSLNLKSFDLILLSYSLTMFQSPLEKVFNHIQNDLKPNGYLAVVDFNTSRLGWFRRWMEMNHVDFSGDLLPMLKKHFVSSEIKTHNAYMGLWTYFQFIGRQTSFTSR